MVASLQEHAQEAKGKGDTEAAQVALKAMVKTNPGPDADRPPPRPEGIVGDEPPPNYTVMLASMIEQIDDKLKKENPKDYYSAFIGGFQEHAANIRMLEKENNAKLKKLLEEESKKITSADIHTGFDSSHVAKAKPGDQKTEVELLNPNFSASADSPSSGSKASVDDDAEIEASAAAKEFARISSTDYAASLQFISKHPQILTEKETDGILVLAFDAALEKNDEYSRQCVHQALLLQYCRALGKDGVGLFFKRITTPAHQARDVFRKDVQDTYLRIKNRATEILAERAQESGEGVEQIQLHAVEPGTVINIKVPAADSEDPDVKKARVIFDDFKPELKKALESGDLEEVNKVLGTMKVDEAEEIVALFGEVSTHSVVAFACLFLRPPRLSPCWTLMLFTSVALGRANRKLAGQYSQP